MSVFVGLVHHPIRDRKGGIITTAVTNLDVHDIARTARTYGVAGYFVITPIEAQRKLVERILWHWSEGAGARRVPERTEALARCRIVKTIAEAEAAVLDREGEAPAVIVTTARADTPTTPYREVSANLRERPGLVLFGTGHGLGPSVMERADYVLPPIQPDSDYNHLAVRAAAAITLDRLLGSFD